MTASFYQLIDIMDHSRDTITVWEKKPVANK